MTRMSASDSPRRLNDSSNGRSRFNSNDKRDSTAGSCTRRHRLGGSSWHSRIGGRAGSRRPLSRDGRPRRVSALEFSFHPLAHLRPRYGPRLFKPLAADVDDVVLGAFGAELTSLSFQLLRSAHPLLD